MLKWVCIFFIIWSGVLLAKEPQVIANSTIPYDTVSRTELVNIFTRKKLFWEDGHRITVFIKPMNSVEHKIFTIDILNMTPYSYKSMADSIIWSGKNTAPREIASDDEMILQLSRTPYSVGYINYSTVIYNSDFDRLVYLKIE